MNKALFKWYPQMSNKQYTVFQWWQSEKYKDFDGIIADGSIRSGKTVSMGFSFVLWAMESFDGMDLALCGKTVGSLRRNVTNTLKKQINQRKGMHAEEKRSDNLIVISYKGRKNNFYLFGGKDESSQDLIQGMTLAGVFFDEVALMPKSFVDQATARCSVDGSKYWFNCNPGNPQHFFKVEWIDRSKERNLLYLHFTMEDNLSLSEKIRQRYEGMYTGVFFRRYILGLWVAAEGLIYDMFAKDKHILSTIPETEGEYYVSSDYGIQNATTFLLWRKIKGTNKWCCLREYYYSGREQNRQKTVSQLVDGLDEMLAGIIPNRIIVDPSAAALMVELRKRGYKTREADNDVLDGIADVGSALNESIICFMNTCKYTIEEFGLYLWDSKAADRGEDKPIKTNDHCMDAVRYFTRTMKLVKKRKHNIEEKQFLVYL